MAIKPVREDPDASLKAFLLHLNSEETRQLHERMGAVRQEGKCIRRYLFLLLLMMLVSLAGLAGSFFLISDISRSTNPLVRHLMALTLGAALTQAICLGLLIWHRRTLTRLREECLGVILAEARAQLKAPASPDLAILALAESPPAQEGDRPEPSQSVGQSDAGASGDTAETLRGLKALGAAEVVFKSQHETIAPE